GIRDPLVTGVQTCALPICGRTPKGDAEFAERNAANLAWLREGFAAARTSRSRAIMVMQQANIFHEFPPIPSELAAQQSGFTDLRSEERRVGKEARRRVAGG